MKIIFLFLATQLIVFGCDNTFNHEPPCEWTHSQIVGHAALLELNDKITALYIGVKCPSGYSQDSFALSNNKSRIALDKVKSDSQVLVLQASIESVNQFLGKDIRDSTNFKKELTFHLENANLINLATNETIPKSSNYYIMYGYVIRRME